MAATPDNPVMATAPPPLLVDSATASKMLSISRALLYQMNASGELGPMPLHFHRKALFRVDELQRWVSADCPPRQQWMKERGQ